MLWSQICDKSCLFVPMGGPYLSNVCHLHVLIVKICLEFGLLHMTSNHHWNSCFKTTDDHASCLWLFNVVMVRKTNEWWANDFIDEHRMSPTNLPTYCGRKALESLVLWIISWKRSYSSVASSGALVKVNLHKYKNKERLSPALIKHLFPIELEV